MSGQQPNGHIPGQPQASPPGQPLLTPLDNFRVQAAELAQKGNKKVGGGGGPLSEPAGASNGPTTTNYTVNMNFNLS